MAKIIIHSDASCGADVIGLGYTIEGEVEHSDSKIRYENCSSMEAEVYALLEALRVATYRLNKHETCDVYIDVDPLVRKLNGSERTTGDWPDYRASCLWLLGRFDEWSIESIPRSQNKEADQLARTALERGRENQSKELSASDD